MRALTSKKCKVNHMVAQKISLTFVTLIGRILCSHSDKVCCELNKSL